MTGWVISGWRPNGSSHGSNRQGKYKVKWIEARDYEEMSRMAAERMFKVISENLARRNAAMTGMATGNTMIKLYSILTGMLNKAGLGLSNFSTFNLDEYVDKDGKNVCPDHPLSYCRYMVEKFSDLLDPGLGFKRDNMFFPDAGNPAKYDTQIDDAGGLDLQLLGIGFNGHIAFNEPIRAGEMPEQDFAALPSRVIQLDELTIRTNARLTAGGDMKIVPHKAVTMGMKSILKAKEIMLLACFSEQAVPLGRIKSGKISTENPASFLWNHPSVEVIYTTDTIKL